MPQERWAEIERVYHAALARDAATRGAFLDAACAGDVALRQEVESLLRYHAPAERFLERSALQETARQISQGNVPPAAPGIPGYTILELLGEGGMGVVYLAEQNAPLRRRVALKLIKPGMDSRQVVMRFETEKQALARMDHPYIAAVFDAGTSADGPPYFVMEYVAGAPITEYCDRQRLSTRERLDLFVQVCSAVQHAHQKGVIHRDLKPSNILILEDDGRPRPKIIDFGIAKAIESSLAGRVAFTEQGTVVGTPEYMSPEQAAFSPDIDTTTDVYSLGVILYELLVGALPFDAKLLRGAGHDEMRRAIRDSDPPKPSALLASTPGTAEAVAANRQSDAGRLTRHLKGDLDWITLKALEKDRRRRYSTVAALAADVERYLADQPVEARPPSAGYRIRKFTRRNRSAVAGASAILLALLLGLTASLTQYVRAERQRAVADRERAQANVQRATAEAATAEATARRTEAERASAEAATQRKAAMIATAEADRHRIAAMNEATSANAARREAEYRAYVATITAADGELRANLHSSARARLLAVSPDRRGWEWHHLFLRSDASLMTLESDVPCESWFVTNREPLMQGETSPGAVVRFTWRSANALVLQDRDPRMSLRRCNRIDTWDATTGARQAWQAAGPILATGANGDMLTLISTESRPARWEVHLVAAGSTVPISRAGPFEAQPVCAAISRDGGRIAVGLLPARSQTGWPLDDIYEIWDMQTPRRVARMVPEKPPQDSRTPPACLVTFSPDSTLVATSGATVDVWRVDSGALVASDVVQAGKVSQPIAFSPDGTRLAIGRLTGLVDLLHLDRPSRLDHLDGNGFIKVLPLPDAERYFLLSRRRKNEVLSVAFSPDGARIVTGTDVNVGVWDVSQRQLTAVMPGHESEVVGVAIATDGRIVTGDARGIVKVWPASLSSGVTVLRGAFSPGPSDHVVSPDGTVAAVAQLDGGLSAWRLSDSSPISVRTGSGKPDSPRWVRSLAMSGDGRLLLVGENDPVGTVRTFAIPAGQSVAAVSMHRSFEAGCESPIPTQHYPVFVMALGPDGRSLAFQHGNCLIVRDLQTMRTIATLHEHPTAFAFRPDGSLIVASYPQQGRPTTRMRAARRVPTRFRIWDWRASVERANVPAPTVSGPDPAGWRIALSADGSRVVFLNRAGSSPTGAVTVSIWDGGLRREIGRLPVPRDTFAVALTPDGRRIATTDPTSTAVRIWDTERRQLLMLLLDDDHHSGGIAFTPDGRLIVGRASGGLTIWETQKPACSFCPTGLAP